MTFRLGTGKSITFFYSVLLLRGEVCDSVTGYIMYSHAFFLLDLAGLYRDGFSDSVQYVATKIQSFSFTIVTYIRTKLPQIHS